MHASAAAAAAAFSFFPFVLLNGRASSQLLHGSFESETVYMQQYFLTWSGQFEVKKTASCCAFVVLNVAWCAHKDCMYAARPPLFGHIVLMRAG